MDYLIFKAKDIISFRSLFKNLHACFSQFKKNEGKNHVGIAFPNMKDDDTGLVVHVFGDIKYLFIIQGQQGVARLISQGKITNKLAKVNDATSYVYRAYIRNRKLERGSPSQTMKRLSSCSHENNKQLRQFSMSRYFNSTLPAINIQSKSSKRNFTIYISTLENNVFPSAPPEFNAYGLSNSSNPCFLPCVKAKT